MNDALVPAHILFARWFIRIRWFALIILVSSNFVVKNVFDVSIQEKPIYVLTFSLFVLNVLHTIILRRITKTGEL